MGGRGPGEQLGGDNGGGDVARDVGTEGNDGAVAAVVRAAATMAAATAAAAIATAAQGALGEERAVGLLLARPMGDCADSRAN